MKVSQPGDIYEQEADRVAEQASQYHLSPSFEDSLTTICNIDEKDGANRRCESCEEERENGKAKPVAQKRSNIKRDLEESDEPSHGIDEILGNEGSPLDLSTIESMRSGFDFDFSAVRVHTGERSTKSAQALNAIAYTIGTDIVFNAGHYAPNSDGGRKLLMHELTHVIQQSSSEYSLLQRQASGSDEEHHRQVMLESRRREIKLGEAILKENPESMWFSQSEQKTRDEFDMGTSKVDDIVNRRSNGDFDIGDAKGGLPMML